MKILFGYSAKIQVLLPKIFQQIYSYQIILFSSNKQILYMKEKFNSLTWLSKEMLQVRSMTRSEIETQQLLWDVIKIVHLGIELLVEIEIVLYVLLTLSYKMMYV